jgi:hypothetical protein
MAWPSLGTTPQLMFYVWFLVRTRQTKIHRTTNVALGCPDQLCFGLVLAVLFFSGLMMLVLVGCSEF